MPCISPCCPSWVPDVGWGSGADTPRRPQLPRSGALPCARPSRVPGLRALHLTMRPLLGPVFKLLTLDSGPDTPHILKAAPCSLRSQANPHCPSPGQPTLFGTGSDRLPGPRWLPLTGRLVTSRVVMGLSGGTLLWASFSFWIFIPGGLAGFSLAG